MSFTNRKIISTTANVKIIKISGSDNLFDSMVLLSLVIVI